MTNPSGLYDVNAAVGIDYSLMDPAKKFATSIARTTTTFPQRYFPDFRVLEDSYGESAFVYELPGHTLHAQVIECLGTKDRIAQGVLDLLLDPGVDLDISAEEAWQCIGQDNLAMILLDIATRGAHPLTFGMFLAVPEDLWFSHDPRFHSLCRGTYDALKFAGCSWGGGEMPVLNGTVTSGTIVLAGCATGAFFRNDPRNILSADRVRPGQSIILFRSPSVQANGISAIRRLAHRLPQGWRTKISDGQSLARAVLQPTPMYCVALSELFMSECDSLTYAATISGHGGRKIMRAPQPMRYCIEEVREPAPIFRFLQENLNPERSLSDQEMTAAYCFEGGFVLFCESYDSANIVRFIRRLGFDAWEAGYTEAASEKSVVFAPRGYSFGKDDLDIR